MCIRDRFLSYEDRMIIAQRLQENASFGAIGKELGKDRTTIAKAVSYTHLDVYKRQGKNCVIIFDEVQLFPQARQAIKYLVADGRYEYIETGSLLSLIHI